MQRFVQANTCQHQLIFLPALDGAASCARCGAIVLIAPPRHDGRGVHLEWLPASQTSPAPDQGAAGAAGD